MKTSQFYYLIAKLVNKGKVDWENDRDITDAERDIIRQGVRDLAFYSPYQAKPELATSVEAGAKRKSNG